MAHYVAAQIQPLERTGSESRAARKSPFDIGRNPLPGFRKPRSLNHEYRHIPRRQRCGSLRQTIADSAADDFIIFSVTGSILLTSGQLVAARNLTILGPGDSTLVINGNESVRAFYVQTNVSLDLSNLTIANGRGDNGGGVCNAGGELILRRCTLVNNSATGQNGANYSGNPGTNACSGAVCNGGALIARSCAFLSNSVVGGAGAASSWPSGAGGAGGEGNGGAIGAYEFLFTLPRFTGSRLQAPSGFWLESCGLPNRIYVLQVSTNLENWRELTNLAADASGLCEFVDGNLGSSSVRFYRLHLVAP